MPLMQSASQTWMTIQKFLLMPFYRYEHKFIRYFSADLR